MKSMWNIIPNQVVKLYEVWIIVQQLLFFWDDNRFLFFFIWFQLSCFLPGWCRSAWCWISITCTQSQLETSSCLSWATSYTLLGDKGEKGTNDKSISNHSFNLLDPEHKLLCLLRFAGTSDLWSEICGH